VLNHSAAKWKRRQRLEMCLTAKLSSAFKNMAQMHATLKKQQ